jgi:hypothetical protein
MLHLLSAAFKNVDRRTFVFGMIETAIIVALAWHSIFNKPAPEVKVIDNSKQYQDSIQQLQVKFNTVQFDLDRKKFSLDSFVFMKRYNANLYQEKRKYEKTAPIDSVSAFVHRKLHGTK